MLCPECNSENRLGAKFCNECGARLMPQTNPDVSQAQPEDAGEATIEADLEAIPGDACAESENSSLELPDVVAESQEAWQSIMPGPLDVEPLPPVHDFELPQVGSPASSGAISQSALPTIAVEGVNAYRDGAYAQQADFDFEEDSEIEQPELASANNERAAQDIDVLQAVREASAAVSAAQTSSLRPVSSAASQADDTCVIPSAEVEAAAYASAGATMNLRSDAFAGFEQTSDGPGLANDFERGGTMKMPRINADGPSRSGKSFRAETGDSKPHVSKKPLIIALVAVLVVAAAVFGTWYFELWGGVRVPDVTQLTEKSATQILTERGFVVRVEYVKSDDVEGIVLLSDPKAGDRTQKGGQVVIHVSIARTVPDVVGKQEEEAQAILKEDGFENVTVNKEKSNETEGLVLGQTPDAGVKAKAAYPLTLTVAESYVVPDVLSKSSDEAIEALFEEGYEVSISPVYTESSPEGTVVNVEPAAGTKLKSGETVTLYVATSRSRELTEATHSYLAPGSEVQMGGVYYLIDSVDAVSYEGDDITAFTVTAKPFTSFLGEKIYLSARSVSGTIEWTSDNSVRNIVVW